MLDVIVDFTIALILAIHIEWAVVFVFGFRKRSAFFAIAAINLITNPILNYSILIIQSLYFFRIDFFVLIIFELVVVVAEWRMLIFAIGGSAKKLLIVSLVMNLCSFASGLFLFNFV